MLVHHVPPPVVFPGKRLAALSGIGASVLGTVELAGLLVLVVDVAIQMRLGAKPHGATRMRALVRAVMVAFVVIEFVDLVKYPVALVTGEEPGGRVMLHAGPGVDIRPGRRGII